MSPLNKTLIIFSALLLLTACSDTHGQGKQNSQHSLVNTPPASSNTKTIKVPSEINGHRLPAEPDPKINNATVLGVDSNHNGVRDDVERWIYEEYKDKHPIYTALAMDGAKAFQEALTGEGNYEKADKMSNRQLACADYYRNYADKPLIKEDEHPAGRALLVKVLNTKKRVSAYIEYDHSLSGGVYTLPKIKEEKNMCSKRVKEALK